MRAKASEVDWDALQNDDIDVYAGKIFTTIDSLARTCIPNRTVRIKQSDPPWITSDIKCWIRKRKRAYKRALRSDSDRHWYSFRKLRNKVIAMVRNSKRQFSDKLSDKLKSHKLCSKDWWSTLKYFINPASTSSIPPLEYNDNVYTEENDKANILNEFFQSQTVLNENGAALPDIQPTAVETHLDEIVLTPLEVQSTLETLPLGKASGPNGLNNRILRELAMQVSSPYCSLFNQSLRQGIFPTTYKEANVCPVPKKGDQSLVTNYRPISLLNSESKLFERLMFKYLYNHVQRNNLLSSFQSGFIPGDSTVNQLTFMYNTFCEALDSGKEVRAVFCDISKAFDRVWHRGLLHKLQVAGVTENILAWFENYLANRKQRVVLPGTDSQWVYIKAGVPQGSILGPLLFLLFINDIVIEIGSNIRLFADDTSLYIVVENPSTAADCLNTDLVRITNWAATWLVSFNPVKTEALLVSRKRNKPIHPPLFMQDHQITEVESHKHLGIYLSNDCSWHVQIEYIKQKAWFRINVMRKLKFKLDRKALEIIYIAFIRPILEYGDIIWSNCTQYQKNELDKIQNEAARIATGTTKLISLNALYQEVNWDTLDQRRENHKNTMFYKMVNHLTPHYLSSLVPRPVGAASRYSLRNSNSLQTIDARTNQYYHSFLPSSVRAWNNLPNEARQCSSVNSFKHFLNRNLSQTPKHFYSGTRRAQILHTRLRTNCSSLNLDLFHRNITESPLCRCGSIEDAQHYFFHCRIYQLQRVELLNLVSLYLNPSLKVILHGDPALSTEINKTIFDGVQKYILDSKRF
ncbi:MAG: reverse transcriptase family protein [Candidatus Thiodiazotropha taylori]|nr:reverse transcriptase family protein [Candidatus Thiodiazotropha taylori]MCW4335834.1 reverse transcriptase family protein [Candidatus Thiodiazotropha endolucinida]